MTLNAADIRAKRRLELAAFLRERRSSLCPEDVGMTRRGRRHVKGLRRDEVAALAGIGVSWYTLIEQGRDVNVSADAIVRICEALRLDPFAMSHALALALPDVPSARQEVDADVLDRLQAILDTQRLNPAHVLNDAMTVVTWNALAERFYGFRRNAEGFERNLLWLLFNDAAFAKLFPDWDACISNLVGMLRYKYARSVGNPEYESLVHELYKTQREFRRIWDTHHVNGKQTEICAFDHPLVGHCELRLLYSTVHVEPPLVIAFLTPNDPRSVEALERLERMNSPLPVAT